MADLKTLHSEGFFDGVALSETTAPTLRKAHSLFPLSAVELEVSLFCLEPEILESIKVATELNIPVLAYSPLGRGFLGGQIKSIDDLPEGDARRGFPRFQGDNFKKNMELVHDVDKLAKAKAVTPGQVGLAYIMQISSMVGLPRYSTECEGRGGMADVFRIAPSSFPFPVPRKPAGSRRMPMRSMSSSQTLKSPRSKRYSAALRVRGTDMPIPNCW